MGTGVSIALLISVVNINGCNSHEESLSLLSKCSPQSLLINCYQDSRSGNSGKIMIATGAADKDKKPLFGKEPTGAGGSIEISVGEGTWGDGGSIEISAGTTTAAKSSTAYNGVGMIDATGGSIKMNSGDSKQTSSGAISIATADSGFVGVSGELSLNTGSASHGNAGYISEYLRFSSRMFDLSLPT